MGKLCFVLGLSSLLSCGAIETSALYEKCGEVAALGQMDQVIAQIDKLNLSQKGSPEVKLLKYMLVKKPLQKGVRGIVAIFDRYRSIVEGLIEFDHHPLRAFADYQMEKIVAEESVFEKNEVVVPAVFGELKRIATKIVEKKLQRILGEKGQVEIREAVVSQIHDGSEQWRQLEEIAIFESNCADLLFNKEKYRLFEVSMNEQGALKLVLHDETNSMPRTSVDVLI